MMAPILDRLATEFAGKIKFVKINNDEEPQLASRYKVTGLPTIMLVDHGQTLGQSAGLPDEQAFRNELKKWLESRKVAN